MNSWVSSTEIAQARIRTRVWEFVAKHTIHYTTETRTEWNFQLFMIVALPNSLSLSSSLFIYFFIISVHFHFCLIRSIITLTSRKILLITFPIFQLLFCFLFIVFKVLPSRYLCSHLRLPLELCLFSLLNVILHRIHFIVLVLQLCSHAHLQLHLMFFFLCIYIISLCISIDFLFSFPSPNCIYSLLFPQLMFCLI